jgi:hypothetical protein
LRDCGGTMLALPGDLMWQNTLAKDLNAIEVRR